MISKNTAERIWCCYREIAAAKSLLEDMQKAAEEFHGDAYAGRLRDAFGRRSNLQLGVPSGKSSHQLFDVNPELAKSVIIAHIATKQAELVAANEQARMELDVWAESDVVETEAAP